MLCESFKIYKSRNEIIRKQKVEQRAGEVDEVVLYDSK